MAATMRVFICLVLCGICIFVEGYKKQDKKEEGTPALLLEFATIFAGRYRNSVPSTSGSVFDFFFIPVVIPALGDFVTFYFEQRTRVNGEFVLMFQQIYAFTLETPTKIRQAVYNIENPERFGTEREQLKALANLELSELSNRPECDAFFEKADEEFFTGVLATDQCFLNIGGEEVVPVGTRNLTCSELIINGVFRRTSNDKIVTGFEEPAVLEEISNPFPVPVNVFRRNKCFEVPCTDKKSRRSNQPVWGDIRELVGSKFNFRPFHKIILY